MHPEAYGFVERIIERLPPRQCVIDFGGRDVNGSVRGMFPNIDYISVDVVPGAGVDVVADAAAYAPSRTPDTVICCETLEHTENSAQICANACRILSADGVFIATAATDPRRAHSAMDGGDIRAGEWYCNVDPDDLDAWLRKAGFHDWRIETYPQGDIYAVAWRSKPPPGNVDGIKLYAITATLNGINYTRALEKACREADVPLRLVVVDNGSSDGTREWLHNLHSRDQICIISERNLGVSASWNLGIRLAIENGADAVLVCGNDTEPYPGTIERLLSHIRVGCSFVTGTAKPYNTELSVVPAWKSTEGFVASPDFSLFMMSLRTVGALARFETTHGLSTIPHDVGLFDTRFYPAYYEDSDYATRLSAAGIPTLRDPAAFFRHEGSLSYSSNELLRAKVKEGLQRNKALFQRKWGFVPDGKHAVAGEPLHAVENPDSKSHSTIVRADAARRSVQVVGGPVRPRDRAGQGD